MFVTSTAALLPFFGVLFLPRPLWSLNDHAFLDGTRCNPHVSDLAIDQHLDPLKIRHEPPFRDRGDVCSYPTAFLGLAAPPDDAPLNRAFTCDLTNSCHKDIFLNRAAENSITSLGYATIKLQAFSFDLQKSGPI